MGKYYFGGNKMFLELLRLHMEERGLKFSQIAKSVDKSISYVNEIHKGRREIKIDDIIRFSDALSLNLGEKAEFVELYLSERYPELFEFIRMNISGVESVPVLELDSINDNKVSESSSHIPVIYSQIKGLFALKLEHTILEGKFQKGDYIIIKLKEEEKIAEEYAEKNILYSMDNEMSIDKFLIKEDKYFLLDKNIEVPKKEISIIGYIVGKYTNII